MLSREEFSPMSTAEPPGTPPGSSQAEDPDKPAPGVPKPGKTRRPGFLETALPNLALGLLPFFQRLPARWLPPLGRAIGSAAFLVWGRYRRVAIDNLTHAFPEYSPDQIRTIARGCFRNWGIFLLHTLKLPGFTEQEWNDLLAEQGREHFLKARERGKGVLVVTGHMGCFEMGAAWAAHEGVPVSAIARYAKTPELTDRINKIREAAGYRILCYDARGFRAMRLLRANEMVAVVFDQDANTQGIFVDFFGRPAATAIGPAVLAARTGAALLPAWVYRREDGKYQIEIEPEIPVPPRDATPEQLRVTVQEMSSRLEAAIRRHPDQWLWMHRRWKTRPPEEQTAPKPSP
jgi:Kdo2-lipid IVA lauroyltransferase/acyltransferase